MQEAYFSNIRSQILPLLANARESVSVAMAWFTSAELFDALLECIHRGVRVDVILLDDAINFMSFAPDFNRLIEGGGHQKKPLMPEPKRTGQHQEPGKERQYTQVVSLPTPTL